VALQKMQQHQVPSGKTTLAAAAAGISSSRGPAIVYYLYPGLFAVMPGLHHS
jgi:hypothetical protein